ncbi:MAG: hypothetical protein WD009_12245 [Phycisphaeraceae bacterium]
MSRDRLLLSVLCLVAVVLPLGACQTPSEPRAWQDEFTGDAGQYVFASRKSGGYDMRFAVSEQRPGEVQMQVRSPREAIVGRRAYFIIDGERQELPMAVRTSLDDGRATAPYTRTGVQTGSGGSGVHTGVGVTFGGRSQRVVHHATVTLPGDVITQMLNADAVRVRLGEQPGPTFELSETTRQRAAELVRGGDTASD